MDRPLLLALGIASACGCAHTEFYGADGSRLKGLPFVYVDEAGSKHLAFVSTSTGFGTAAFAVDRTQDGGYTKFSTNLNSTAAAELAGGALDQAFDLGKKAALLELQERALRLPADDPARERILRELERMDER
jgi:hypothetical protein